MEKTITVARNHILPVMIFALLVTSCSARLPAQINLQQSVTEITAAEAAKTSSRANTGANNGIHQGPAMVPPHFAQLKLAQGFLLSLNVLDDPDFTGVFRVDDAGNLVLPELGSVRVAGKTVPEARREIAKELLDRGILKDPQVELNVMEYTAPQVTILGAVASPGVFPMLAPEGLADVLALAGDTTILAGDQIEITTPDGGNEPQTVRYSRGMNTNLLNSVIIQPGDTIKVDHAGIVYVLGGVDHPGGYVMQENGNLSVLQAISVAGGTAMTASIKSVYLMRKDSDNSTVWLKLPYKKMTEGKIADVQLHTKDVLFVPTNHFKAALLSTTNVMASVSSASIYAGVLH